MNRWFRGLGFCLLLNVPSAVSAHVGHGYDQVPLPESVFGALEAGQPQTVVLYGTSVTIGGQWAQELNTYFDTLYPGQVTLINSAKSGEHSSWGLEHLQERVLDHKPDLLFLEFAINDAATKHGISTNRCAANLDTMLQAVRTQNPEVEIVLQTMNPAWDSPESAPKKYAGDRPNLEDYYKVYRNYARVKHLPLVDHYPVWKKILDEEPARYQLLVPDGIHPSAQASRTVAWPAIKELLDRARAFAGAEQTRYVWPEGTMPGVHAGSSEGLRSPERTDAIRITNVRDPTLSLFSAKSADSPAPAVIICPGGGYEYCVVDKEGTQIAEWLNSLGIHALVLKYRTPDNRQGALQDMQRAIRLVRGHAKEWGIDPEQVGCIGFSAGGNLCAKASNLFETPAYTAIDSMDQLNCRPDFAMLIYPAYLERDGHLADDLKVDADLPPTLIVHSNDDEHFIAGSRIYAAALKTHNHPNTFLLYETGGHGYGLRSELEARCWPKDAEKWMRSQGLVR